MNKSGSATLPKAVAPGQERKPLAPLPPQQRNGGYTNEDFSDTASGDSSLEGNVQLRVLLPDGTNVAMSVERRMPVMDLLIHVATAHKLSPGNHQMNVFNAQGDVLSCKASTPIGSLNASSVHLVPRRNDVPTKKVPKQVQPFEQTFRLQVHLPRHQLFVVRVSPHARLSDIFNMVCEQKELDPSRYFLQHPTSSELQLDLNRCLADYNLTEINVLSKRASVAIQSRHSTDVEFHRGELEEKKQKQIFGKMFRRSKSSIGDSSSDEHTSRGCSPTIETDHAHQKPSPTNTLTENLKKSAKKRAAPPPPTTKPRSQCERPPPPPPLHPKTTKTQHDEQSQSQSHSRHSSDSSGYHESSVLGDECEIETARSSNLSSTASTSTTSIVSGIKKRRAPLPPPLANKTDEEVSTPRTSECSPSFVAPPSPLEVPSPDTTLDAVSVSVLETTPTPTPPPDDKVFDDISEEPEPESEPVLELTPVTEVDPSLPPVPGKIPLEHPILDRSSFCFDIRDLSADKYREETSGSCSRSDTHTTDSAVADLDLDASGSSSWSPVPEMKPTFVEMAVAEVGQCEEKSQVADECDGKVDGRYDWFSASRTIADSSHDDWIKSSSDDEQDTLEALSSPSSYYSVEDVAASFEQVIADAELALEKDLEAAAAEEAPTPVIHEEKPRFFRRTRPLVNFSIDTYKSRNDDPSILLGYSESFAEPKPAAESPAKPVNRSSSLHDKSAQYIQFKMAPYRDIKRQNSQTDETETETKTNLASKSKSMVNLLDNEAPEMKKSNSEQRINSPDDRPDSPEYLKLQQQQQQLIYWQQQLMSNQALLKQHAVVENTAPEVADLLHNNLEKQISLSTNNLDGMENETENETKAPSKKIAQQKAKSCLDLSPARPFSSAKPEVATNTTVFRVESMKNEQSVDRKEVESKGGSVLPSIRDRISLFGKKSETGQSENSSPNPVQEEKFKTSFERGLAARKPVKMSNFCNATSAKEADKSGQKQSKFRRQRIMPNYLDSKESFDAQNESKPACNGHVVKDSGPRPPTEVVAVPVRKPRQSRPLVCTYFGDPATGKEIPERNGQAESRSAVSKVATSDVLDRPSLPLVVEKSERKMEKNPPLVSKKPLKSTVSNGGRFATAPNPRDTLMDSIRGFGGRNRLRSVPKSETYWHSWHGEVA